MIAAYLKMADLPEVEKAKLELFLHLLGAVEQEPAAEEPLAAPPPPPGRQGCQQKNAACQGG